MVIRYLFPRRPQPVAAATEMVTDSSTWVIGWRRNVIAIPSDGPWLLEPLSVGTPYGVTAEATCQYENEGHESMFGHTAPSQHCQCGFYAYKQPAKALDHLRCGLPLVRVGLKGRVVEHDSGYRAQYIAVTDIWLGNCVKCGPDTSRIARVLVSEAFAGRRRAGQSVCTEHAWTIAGASPERHFHQLGEIAAHLGVSVHAGLPDIG